MCHFNQFYPTDKRTKSCGNCRLFYLNRFRAQSFKLYYISTTVCSSKLLISIYQIFRISETAPKTDIFYFLPYTDIFVNSRGNFVSAIISPTITTFLFSIKLQISVFHGNICITLEFYKCIKITGPAACLLLLRN